MARSTLARRQGRRLRCSARNALRDGHDMYASLDEDRPYDGAGPGLLRARLKRSAS
jgi:hypothetical protein